MRVVSGLLLLVAVAAPTSAFAYSWAPNAIPNGTTYSCATCHTRSTGGAGWNDFGNEIRTLRAINFGGRTIDWAALYDLDSDGDGFTNGAELGDPDGDRTPIPGFSATRPGDATSFPAPCGNAQLDEGEECDGALFADDATCESLGFFSGSLACTSTCEVNDSACLAEETDAGGGDDAGMDAGGGEDAGMDAGGGEDAGTGEDAGASDAGPSEDTFSELDGGGEADGGGGSDAGASTDAGTDTTAVGDASGEADSSVGGGSEDAETEEESGCSVSSSSPSTGGWLTAIGLAALLIRRRRAA
jgi:MYXO-CTERM domain-containing protein